MLKTLQVFGNTEQYSKSSSEKKKKKIRVPIPILRGKVLNTLLDLDIRVQALTCVDRSLLPGSMLGSNGVHASICCAMFTVWP